MSFTFDAAVTNGAVVGVITAIDPDTATGDTLRYSFSGGSPTDPTGALTMNSSTGVVTVLNADLIGSQDGSDQSPAGWYFMCGVEVADNQPATPNASMPVSFNAKGELYKLDSPDHGEAISTTAHVVVKGTRRKGVEVTWTIYKKQGADWVKELSHQFPRQSPVNQNAQVIEHDFGILGPGDYRIKYEYKETPAGMKKTVDVGKNAAEEGMRHFRVVAPLNTP